MTIDDDDIDSLGSQPLSSVGLTEVSSSLSTTNSSKKRRRDFTIEELKKLHRDKLIRMIIDLQQELLNQSTKRAKSLSAASSPKETVGSNLAESPPLNIHERVKQKIVSALLNTSITSKTNTVRRPVVCVELEAFAEEFGTFVGNIGSQLRDTPRSIARKFNPSEIKSLLPTLPDECDAMYSFEASLMTAVQFESLEVRYNKGARRARFKFKVFKSPGAGIYSVDTLYSNNALQQ